MKKNKSMFIISCIFLISGCTPEGIFDLGYGIRGGYDVDTDFALGSHVTKAKADLAWKECYNKYIRINSALVEQCMNDKGLIRLSEIRRRQKMAEETQK